MQTQKEYFLYDMLNQRQEIISYYEELRKERKNISIETAALEWIYKFAYSWRISHNLQN